MLRNANKVFPNLTEPEPNRIFSSRFEPLSSMMGCLKADFFGGWGAEALPHKRRERECAPHRTPRPNLRAAEKNRKSQEMPGKYR